MPFLAHTLVRLGFKPHFANPNLCTKESEHGHEATDTHVDDAIVDAKKPQDTMSQVEQKCTLRNVKMDPSQCVGSRLTKWKSTYQHGRILQRSNKKIRKET